MSTETVAALTWDQERQLRAAVRSGLVLIDAQAEALVASLLAGLDEVRAAGLRLSEAIGNREALHVLAQDRPGTIPWRRLLAADDEYLNALQALRTACDGRPRP